MIWKENREWLKEQIAAQCAPLLAGLKPSNLLIIPKEWAESLQQALNGTKFEFFCLSEYDEKLVYLLYRANELMMYLAEEEVEKLLRELGYKGGGLYSLLWKVSEKYMAHKRDHSAFPHELGLLLGYPVVDVRGFMEHGGKDFLYSGYWKVYGNVRETVSLFREFGRAKELLMRFVAEGGSLADYQELYCKSRSCILAAG